MGKRIRVHKPRGADRLVVEAGGSIDINGGQITNAGVQVAAIADHADPATATAEQIATKQNAILAALRGVGIIAS